VPTFTGLQITRCADRQAKCQVTPEGAYPRRFGAEMSGSWRSVQLIVKMSPMVLQQTFTRPLSVGSAPHPLTDPTPPTQPLRPRVIQRVTGAHHIEPALALGGSASRVLTPDTRPSYDSLSWRSAIASSCAAILNPAVSA
jgi:hypothetical protein